MPDRDGYPTEEEIKTVADWDLTKQDAHKLIEYLETIWWHEEGIQFNGRTLHLHTYGWSGNEDIIQAMKGSQFWMRFWDTTRRGGHYTFKGIKKGLLK